MQQVWRDRLNRWLMPLAGRVAISPNTITSLALLVNLTGSAALATARRQHGLFLAAAVIIGVGGLLDALDGAVARAKGLTSPFGDFLDHLFDRISDVAVLIGWCVGAAVRPAITISAVLAVMLNGYIGTQIEATFGRRIYAGTGRGEFVLAAVTFPLIQFTLLRGGVSERLIAGFTPAEWLTLVIVLFAVVGIVERFFVARKLAQ